MKIDILCGSGSPDGVVLSDIHGSNGRIGVGGSEYALLTLAEAWAKRGDEVCVYNNPRHPFETFEQRSISDFNRGGKRDFLVVFREPTSVNLGSGKKIFWSCDQFTVGNFSDFSKLVDQTVTISPYHTQYFKEKYDIEAQHIDLPVRTWEYDNKTEKVKNRIIFTSVPDRGLDIVALIFPRILEKVPDASLVVTSDYRLWGSGQPMNSQYVQKFLRMPNVQFLGGVKRDRLIEEQLKAQVHLYPFGGQTEELFCIAVAESQVAGVLPITSPDGAIGTTNMGILMDGSARTPAVQQAFVDTVATHIQRDDLSDVQDGLREKARKRFDVNRILQEWDEKVFV